MGVGYRGHHVGRGFPGVSPGDPGEARTRDSPRSFPRRRSRAVFVSLILGSVRVHRRAETEFFSSASSPANPFCTRFTRPGRLPYDFSGGRIPDEVGGDDRGRGDTGRDDRDDGNGVDPAADVAIADRLLVALRAQRLGLIVGPHGSGKSTLLKTLEPGLRRRFPQVRFVVLQGPLTSGLTGKETTFSRGLRRARCRATNRRKVWAAGRRLPAGGLLVVDGMEQLGAWGRFACSLWWRWRGQLVLGTSHRSLFGFRELWRTEVTPRLVTGLATRLLARADPQVVSSVRLAMSRRDMGRISNVRELWFDLYDVAQDD